MFPQSTGPDAARYKYSQNSLFETPRETPAYLAVFLAKKCLHNNYLRIHMDDFMHSGSAIITAVKHSYLLKHNFFPLSVERSTS